MLSKRESVFRNMTFSIVEAHRVTHNKKHDLTTNIKLRSMCCLMSHIKIFLSTRKMEKQVSSFFIVYQMEYVVDPKVDCIVLYCIVVFIDHIMKTRNYKYKNK